jgi:selenocysteine lyase/cysteine desulfurase
VVSPFLNDPAKLRAVRDALPAVGAGIYVDTAEAGPLPAETAAAMAELADHELRFGRAHHASLEDAAERRVEARAALAAVVSSDVGTIALTHGSREALALAFRGVDWVPGDVLLTLDDAGGDVHAAAAGLVERRGIRVVEVVSARAAAGLADALAREPRVRLVALPHVGGFGRLHPVPALAAAVRARRPEVAVVADGRMAVGAIPVAVDGLAVDAYAIAGDAWLLGPSSTGALWVGAGSGDRLRADLAGTDAVGPEGRRAGDARGWEASTLATRDAVGLARSAGWLSMYVGLDWVLRRPRELTAAVLDRLGRIGGLELLTPTATGEHASVVAFRLARWPAADAVAELGRRVFAIAGTVRSGPAGSDAVRISLACFNEPSELERLCDAIALLAEHAPDTLPRRTALQVLRG